MLAKLPGWVVDNATSVREECARYRDMTPDQRSEQAGFACELAASIIEGRSDRQRVLDWVDALPASTLQVLARLRAAYRGRST